MKGKRYKNKKSNKKVILTIFCIIFIILLIISGIMILRWVNENKEINDIIGKVKNTVSIDENIDDVEKYNVNFEELKQTNSDTIAWIKVNGTNIEYPIVKTTNNDYYMTHTFNKKYNSAGWVFMEFRDKFDGTDNNIVIYAHNRRDGSMFGTLKNILTEEWQSNTNNFTIPFITENEKGEYQVFSVYTIEEEDYYITTKFKKSNDFEKFLDTIKSRSMKDFGIEVGTNDQILTLSTCADNNKYRVVLHAKKIK